MSYKQQQQQQQKSKTYSFDQADHLFKILKHIPQIYLIFVVVGR